MESRLAQSKACSCSYTTASRLAPPAAGRSRPSCASLSSHSHTQTASRRQGHQQHEISARPSGVCAASTRPEPSSSAQQQSQQQISGYTPANFVSFSDKPEHRCHHLVGVEVDAPAAVCFSIWSNWNNVVEFMDLVAQIGLDPSQENFALFQCFYRWGLLPVMEIVFLMEKTHVEQDKLIQFETVQGMPASGDVQFIEKDGKTTVLFKLQHQLPNLLVDLQVDTFAVESSCREIFTDNLLRFKQIAEDVARDATAVPRPDLLPGAPSLGIPIEQDFEGEEDDSAVVDDDDEEDEEEEGEDEDEMDEYEMEAALAAAAADEAAVPSAAAAAAAPAEPAEPAAVQGGVAASTKRTTRRKAAPADAPAAPPAEPKAKAKRARGRASGDSSSS